MMVVASEVGVMDFEPGEIKEKGRLQPGKILMIDTEQGKIYYDGELKRTTGIGTSLSRLAVCQSHRARYLEKRTQDRQPNRRL